MTTRLHGRAKADLREWVMRRDRYVCQRCGRKTSDDVADFDPRKAQMAHKQGLGRGGEDTPENCECSCLSCHLEDEHHPKSIRSKGMI